MSGKYCLRATDNIELAFLLLIIKEINIEMEKVVSTFCVLSTN